MSMVRVNGIDLFYQDKGEGPPLLLLHGAGCQASIWDPVIPALTESFRVVAPDRRGYGHSWVPSASPKAYFGLNADDAASLLNALGGAPATVVGWSSGGLVALHLAVRHPELVSHLVLVEPPLYATQHRTPSMVLTFSIIQVQRMLGYPRAAAATFFRWATRHPSGECGFDKLDPKIRASMLDESAMVMTELDAGTGEELTTDQLASIRCPITCLVGSLSPKELRSASTRLAELRTGVTLVTVEGAGHLLHVEQPVAFVNAVQEAAAGPLVPVVPLPKPAPEFRIPLPH